MNCNINGTQCRALVDSGSIISLIRPCSLAGMDRPKPRVWRLTEPYIITVTGERTRMGGKRSLKVTVANRIVSNKFWLADIQNPCIVGLDLLARGDVVHVPRATRLKP